MESKIKNPYIKIFPYALIACMLLFCCIGCDKTEPQKAATASTAVDKDYQRGPLTVHVRLDKTTMTIADTFSLELEAAIKTGFEVKMPEVAKSLSGQNIGMVDWDNLGDKLDPNNNVVSKYRYRLEPLLSGNFEIPALTFEFYDVNAPSDKKYELTTDPVKIEVTSLIGDQRDKLVISDIEDVVQMHTKIPYWPFWSLGIVAIAGSAGSLFYLRRKKITEIIRIFKSPHEIAYQKLQKLVDQNLIEKGMIKEFYQQISDILRHYIEHRFNLRAPEKTTEEFLVELAGTDFLTSSDKSDLAEFLKLCDLVKFAKHNPITGQIQMTFDLVKNFIEKTKSDEKKIDVTEQAIAEVI